MTADWIDIDGSSGEGGGQILRSALALSLITGRPFRLSAIRARRAKPGLLRQHLASVKAATMIGNATVRGDELGSTRLEFAPETIKGGDYTFPIGTAGSTTLVLQTILPALLTASTASRVVVEGGTHNPSAPPFDFIARSFVPVLQAMGARVDVQLEADGFYPAGGGRLVATIEPGRLRRVELLTRGSITVKARSLLANLPDAIAKRELSIVRERFSLGREDSLIVRSTTSIGPGNVLMIDVIAAGGIEVVTSVGEKGVSAERVAALACDEAERFIAADVPVGPHLADQLLLPMALAGGGAFRTLSPTAHTTTNATVIERFLDVPITIQQEDGDRALVRIGCRETRTTP